MNRLAILFGVVLPVVLAVSPAAAEGKVFKVLVINFDPVIESEGGKRLHQVCGWSDPKTLAKTYVKDLEECSHGWAKYSIVDWIDADVYPVKRDGFRYTDDSYMQCYRGKAKWHQPDGVDYRAVIRDYKLGERVKAGKIDEVLMFGAPYFGYWESQMVGPTAYWCNSEGMNDATAGRNFIIMGFNYERGVGEMLEDYGHRTESIMSHVYGGWNSDSPKTNWDLFALYDKVAPGKAACGNVHYAPNSPGDYAWGDKAKVWSACDDWLTNWPNLKGTKKMVDCSEWGGGDIRAHHRWWFTHIPHAEGVNADGKQNNWWKYLADFNSYPESR